MSLRRQAEADLSAILEDRLGFGWPIIVTNPAGVSSVLTGFSNDIAQAIDPDTLAPISGRTVSVALRIQALYAAGFELPTTPGAGSQKPWVVQFLDVHGAPQKFKVIDPRPDRGLGLIVCLLESYQ